MLVSFAGVCVCVHSSGSVSLTQPGASPAPVVFLSFGCFLLNRNVAGSHIVTASPTACDGEL